MIFKTLHTLWGQGYLFRVSSGPLQLRTIVLKKHISIPHVIKQHSKGKLDTLHFVFYFFYMEQSSINLIDMHKNVNKIMLVG